MLRCCIAAENRKLRRALIWAVFLLLPLLAGVYGRVNYLQNLEILTPGWYNLWTQHTLFYSLFFFAPMTALYTAYLWRLEHLGHNWNLIMTVPVPRFDLYLGKFLVAWKMVLLTQLWVFALFVLFGKLWVGLPGWPPAEILFWAVRGTLGGAAVIALHLVISMLIRSFAAPILLALAGGVLGAYFANENLGLFWPYALMMSGMNSNRAEDLLDGRMGPFLLACLVWTLLAFAAGWLLLNRRDVRSE